LLAALAFRARDRTAVALPWSLLTLAAATYVASTTKVETVPILAALLLTVGEVLVLTAVALFFSSFSTPFLTALLTFGVWVTGRSADAMATMKSSAIPAFVRAALKQVAVFWPNFNLFVPGRHTLETQLTQTAGPLSYAGSTLLYAATYSFVVLMIAALVFRRRDFL
jgi:ABC-type transport system involved in multi-copper enzyme maturation permease subunit